MDLEGPEGPGEVGASGPSPQAHVDDLAHRGDPSPLHPGPTKELRSIGNMETVPPVIEMQPWARSLVRAVANGTYGTLKIDLARPTWTKVRGRDSAPYQGTQAYLARQRDSHGTQYGNSMPNLTLQEPTTVVHGARLKVMRCAAAGPVVHTPKGPRHALNAGLGLNLDLTGQGVSAVVRLKLMDAVRLHAVPSPTFKIKHSFPLWNTGLCLHAAFMQPLDLNCLSRLGKSGAWNLALGRTGDNRFVVGPDKIELCNQRVELGRNVLLHVNGEIGYPRRLPCVNWTEQLNFLPSRIAVKVGW